VVERSIQQFQVNLKKNIVLKLIKMQ